MVKVTFTLDRPTVDELRQAADRLDRPQSFVVREAIHEYAHRIGQLSERERRTMLRVFDAVVPAIPTRPLRQVQAELTEIRAARRMGGRHTRA